MTCAAIGGFFFAISNYRPTKRERNGLKVQLAHGVRNAKKYIEREVKILNNAQPALPLHNSQCLPY
jgi:hypothetical protein